MPWTGLVHCKESILDTFCAFVDLCIRGFKCYESHRSRFRQSTTALFRQALPSNTKPVTYKVRRNVKEVQGGSGRTPVRLSEHRIFYIAYTEETGPIQINVIDITRTRMAIGCERFGCIACTKPGKRFFALPGQRMSLMGKRKSKLGEETR